MRVIGLIGCVMPIALLASAVGAEARCADDMQELQARIERMRASQPTPESATAAKILQKFNDNPTADEVDCYNALARARRALNTGASGTTVPEGQAVQPQQQQQLQQQEPRQLPGQNPQ